MARLDTICCINMGASPASSTYNESGEGLPFYQGNADFGEKYPTPRIWCNAPVKIAQKGDVLISVRAPIGAMNIATERCCIGRGLAALTVNETVSDTGYLWYGIISKINELNTKGTGSTFKAISRKVLEETDIPFPDLPTQRRIAATLDKVSEGIELCRKMLGDLEEVVKGRFVEMFGNPVINPKGYEVHQLAEYILFLTSGSRGWAKYYSDEGEWFITIKNVKDCRISVDDVQCIKPPQNAEAERTRLREGDLLISITADLGRTGVVTKEIAEHGAYNNQHLTSIRLDQTVLDPLYVAYFMESPAGKSQFESKNMSAVKAGLNFDSIRSLKLLVPPLELQKQFVAFVAQTDKSKLVVQRQLSALETLKKSLMQKYF